MILCIVPLSAGIYSFMLKGTVDTKYSIQAFFIHHNADGRSGEFLCSKNFSGALQKFSFARLSKQLNELGESFKISEY